MTDREIDWRVIATNLYAAIGMIEEATDGGALYWPEGVQPAINAYEYALELARWER